MGWARTTGLFHFDFVCVCGPVCAFVCILVWFMECLCEVGMPNDKIELVERG